MNYIAPVTGFGWPLRLEPAYLDDPVPRSMGRPKKHHEVLRVNEDLEMAWRTRLMALGFTFEQQQEALQLRPRGYTVDAAARIVLAGGYNSRLFNNVRERA